MTTEEQSGESPLKQTPLNALHEELGARMVPFAGYAMPVQFSEGIIAEHRHTRRAAGLFDVSHMGQAVLEGLGDNDPAALIEELMPGEIQALAPGRTRYSQLTNERGGILDDLMVTRRAEGEGLYIVVNAACKEQDFAHIEEALAGRARLTRLEDRALLALQGPEAVNVLEPLAPGAAGLVFLEQQPLSVDGIDCLVSRSGYSGEDGYEISVPADEAEALARKLLEAEEVAPVGLGARDSLRLEAGLCLYGHDIDETTTPVEAGLTWSIGKRRRAEGGFPGAEIIQKQIEEGPERLRVGLRPESRAPLREGIELLEEGGGEVGVITSGGFSPSLGIPIAMGYLPRHLSEPGTRVAALSRGKEVPCDVVGLPFVPSHTVSRIKK
ncbi:MAG: glycine cleavage system aminomethyltransferase GcvT [Limibacillus sp.]